MNRLMLVLFVLNLLAVRVAVAEDPLTLDSVPPVVVKTVPAAGSADVDPALTEIAVKFSKPMQDGSWSWSTVAKDSVPHVTDKPRFKDDRTCVLPVKLEPGRTYGIWLNSNKFKNFKGTDGQPAVPYLLVFQTAETVQ